MPEGHEMKACWTEPELAFNFLWSYQSLVLSYISSILYDYCFFCVYVEYEVLKTLVFKYKIQTFYYKLVGLYYLSIVFDYKLVGFYYLSTVFDYKTGVFNLPEVSVDYKQTVLQEMKFKLYLSCSTST